MKLQLLPSLSAYDSLSQKVHAESIRIMFRNIPRIVASTALMIAVMVWVMWEQVESSVVIAWLLCVLCIHGIEMAMSRSFMKRQLQQDEVLRWGRRYTFLTLVSGVVWGMAAWLFFIPGSAVLQVFLFTSIVGMATSSIFQHAYWLESYYGFTLPLLGLSGLRILWEGGAAYQGLAILTVLLLVTAIQMARDAEKSILSAIRLGFENTGLIAQLTNEKEKAELASRDKTRFLASASHDLRQPVHALTLFAEALQPELHTEKGQSLLQNINRSIGAINQLLSSLLDISRLDAKIVHAHPAHIPLDLMLAQLNAEYAPQARAKGLGWNVPDSGVHVYTDPALLEQVMRNLISNALRYTEQGSIEITVKVQEGEVCITVADTGVGIPKALQKDIFREFYQVGNAERARARGLGLGLAIVDRLLTLLKHRIVVESEPGKGSRFSIILPAGEAPSQASLAPATANSQASLNGLPVLVIDDDRDVLESMRVALTEWGCHAYLAETWQQAQHLLAGGDSVQAVITDYRLRDGVTGVQSIEQLFLTSGRRVPVLIITGDTAPERLREVQGSGYALMHKPVQPAKLRAWLRSVQRSSIQQADRESAG